MDRALLARDGLAAVPHLNFPLSGYLYLLGGLRGCCSVGGSRDAQGRQAGRVGKQVQTLSPLCAACPLPSRLQQARRGKSCSVHLPPFPLCRRPGSGGAGSAAGAALSAGSTADACTFRDVRPAVAVCQCSFSAGLPVCRGAAGREHGAPRPASPAPSSLHHAAPNWATHPLALLAIWLKRRAAVEGLAHDSQLSRPSCGFTSMQQAWQEISCSNAELRCLNNNQVLQHRHMQELEGWRMQISRWAVLRASWNWHICGSGKVSVSTSTLSDITLRHS